VVGVAEALDDPPGRHRVELAGPISTTGISPTSEISWSDGSGCDGAPSNSTLISPSGTMYFFASSRLRNTSDAISDFTAYSGVPFSTSFCIRSAIASHHRMSTFQPSAARTTEITGETGRETRQVSRGGADGVLAVRWRRLLALQPEGLELRIVKVWDSMSTSRALSASGGAFMRKRSARGSSTMALW
jgi:hypothetical protein